MLKKYRNQLFELVIEQKINPALFEVSEEKRRDSLYPIEYYLVIFTLKNSPLSFRIRSFQGDIHTFTCQYVQADPCFTMSRMLPTSEKATIDEIAEIFKQWLNEHIKVYLEDLETPNLWESNKTFQSILNTTVIEPDMYLPFSEQEKEAVRQGLEQFRLQAQVVLQLPEGETELLNKKIDYLCKGLDRLNKIDWNSIAISTLISITVALSLDTEKGRMLFELFHKALISIIRLFLP